MQAERLDERIVRTDAPNGLTILTEEIPSVRSAAVGIWVRAASAHEVPERMGVSHLLEHMVFKGTERRTARQLALELEVRGGSLDAYTSRDHTHYQAHVLDRDLPLAVDILTDLVRRPLLREQDLDLERQVVLEEISGVEDTPDDLVFELHSRALFPRHPYGFSILGTRETVAGLTTEHLRALHTGGYYPGNCVIAAAGRIPADALMDALQREGWFAESDPMPPQPPVTPEAAVRGTDRQESRETAQTHIVLGSDTFSSRDPRRFALGILTNVLGGGMSSRLFQRVREELGLAYAIYAYQQLYLGCGLFGVYCATQHDSAEQAIAVIKDELHRLAAKGLSAEELADGKRQLQGQLMLSLESPASRMHRLAAQELNQQPYRPLDAVLQDIEAIAPDTIAEVAAYLAPDRQTVVRLGKRT